MLVLPLDKPGPRKEDTAVGQILGRIFVGAEFGHAAGASELAFVVPLLGEGHEEAFLALFVLEGHHGLLDVVVIRLELALKIDGLVIEAGQGQTYGLKLALALDSAPVLGADVDSDGVEEILVVVMPSEAADLFKAKYVLEGGAFEFRVRHRGQVHHGVCFGVGTLPAAAGGELVTDEDLPAVFILHRDGLDHDVHQVAASLDTNYVQDAPFGLHEERLHISIRICLTCQLCVENHSSSNPGSPSASCNFGFKVRQISEEPTPLNSLSLFFALPSSWMTSWRISSLLWQMKGASPPTS